MRASLLIVTLSACESTVVSGDSPWLDFSERSYARAMTLAQHDATWADYLGPNPYPDTTSDPNMVLVYISDLGVVCQAPIFDVTCGGHWWLSIYVPPGDLTVGAHDLGGWETRGYYEHAPRTGPNDCGRDSAYSFPGVLEILEVTDEHIRFRLDVPPGEFMEDADPSGEYTAAFCP